MTAEARPKAHYFAVGVDRYCPDVQAAVVEVNDLPRAIALFAELGCEHIARADHVLLHVLRCSFLAVTPTTQGEGREGVG